MKRIFPTLAVGLSLALLCVGVACLQHRTAYALSKDDFARAQRVENQQRLALSSTMLEVLFGGKPPNSGSAWNPDLLPGLLIWLSASNVTHTGSTLTGWPDLSGNGYNCSNISTTAPTYSATGFNGHPGVTFTKANGTACYSSRSLSIPSTGTLSIFVLGSVPSGSTSASGRLVSLDTTAGQDYQTPAIEMDTGGTVGNLSFTSTSNLGNGGSSASFSLNTPYAWGGIIDGANGHMYLNNAEQGSATSFSSSVLGGTNCISIGLQQDTCGSPSNGALDATIAEIVVTSNAISSGNRSLLETYFVSKGL